MASANRFTRSEAQQFLASAKRVMRTPELDILLAPAAHGQGRLLVVTPRRIGTAPQRNTVRRRLKALFQRQGLSKYGRDCAVIVKSPGVDLSSERLGDFLQRAFAKINPK